MKSSPSAINNVRRSTCAPSLADRRSTSIVLPSTALYCLPPLSTIAYLIFSPVIHFAEWLAGFLQPSPAHGEAGFIKQPPRQIQLPGQKRTILYMSGEAASSRYRLLRQRGLPKRVAEFVSTRADSVDISPGARAPGQSPERSGEAIWAVSKSGSWSRPVTRRRVP